MTFEQFALSEPLQKAILDAGYTEPTDIQSKAIPVILSGSDVLGIAQTGTGKTASFTLPLIEKLSKGRAKARMPRSLIIAPTRELADQVNDNFIKYGKYHKFKTALLIGGVAFNEQEKLLVNGVDVLIATPGRLLDHFERGNLLMTGVEILVIDEADRMLDMGFIPEIEKICKLCPPARQTLFFSATMPDEISKLATKFLRNPERIEAARPATTADTVVQFAYFIDKNFAKLKREAIRKIIAQCEVTNAIIFCNRKKDVDILAKSMTKHGYSAAAIHGDLDQRVRMQVLERFKSNELSYLIASDVAARGLDIPEVSHVFNYDISNHPDDYVHRIGRTGRAGKTGEAHSLVCPEHKNAYEAIVKLIGTSPEEVSLTIDDRPAKPQRVNTKKEESVNLKKDGDEKKSPAQSNSQLIDRAQSSHEVEIDDEFIARNFLKIQSALRNHFEMLRKHAGRNPHMQTLIDRHLEESYADQDVTKSSEAPLKDEIQGFGEYVPQFMCCDPCE